MKRMLAICVCVALAGTAALAGQDKHKEDIQKLGRAFVEAVKHRDMVAAAQCWLPHHRLEELLENTEGSIPQKLRKSATSERMAARMRERNENIDRKIRRLFRAIEKRGLSTSSMKLDRASAVNLRTQGPLVIAKAVELHIRLSDSTKMEYRIEGATKVAGLWYFSGPPQSSIALVQNGQKSRITLAGPDEVATAVQTALSTLRTAQRAYKAAEGRYAPSLHALEDNGYIAPSDFEELKGVKYADFSVDGTTDDGNGIAQWKGSVEGYEWSSRYITARGEFGGSKK